MIPQTPRQQHLPNLFDRHDRAKDLNKVSSAQGIRAVATGVLEVIRVMIALDKDAYGPTAMDDRRARIAHSVAVCLSMTGTPGRAEGFRLLLAMATKAIRERGVRGPAGALVLAAHRLGEALLAPKERSERALQSAADAAIRALAQYGATPAEVAQLRAQGERLFLAQLRDFRRSLGRQLRQVHRSGVRQPVRDLVDRRVRTLEGNGGVASRCAPRCRVRLPL